MAPSIQNKIKTVQIRYKKIHETLFQCEICQDHFTDRSAAYHHSYKHDSSKTFKCNFNDCDQLFKNPKRLSEHKRRKHFNCNFLCEICGYMTRFAHNLFTHVRTHTPNDKSYCCDRCGICFKSLSQLSEHFRVHRYKTYDTDSNLRRSYGCKECAVVFSSSKSFYHHRRLHLPSKSYTCNICGATFSQAAGISQHYRWHKTQNEQNVATKITIEVLE